MRNAGALKHTLSLTLGARFESVARMDYADHAGVEQVEVNGRVIDITRKPRAFAALDTTNCRRAKGPPLGRWHSMSF